MTSLRTWVHRRAAQRGLQGHEHVSRQRHRALVLLLFGAVRIVAWMILGVLVGLGLLHVGGFIWAKDLAESVPFVALISIYANWATDVDSATAAYAALVAADSHHDAEAARGALEADPGELGTDIARLADLPPGDEARALAADIRRRLGGTRGESR